MEAQLRTAGVAESEGGGEPDLDRGVQKGRSLEQLHLQKRRSLPLREEGLWEEITD